MSYKKPLIITSGQQEIIQSGDTIDPEFYPDHSLIVYGLLGSAILGQTVGCNLIMQTNTGGTLTSGLVQFSAVYLPKAATLTGVKWLVQTQGVYTADQYNGVGLYTYSAGTLTLVASSTNDGNIWKGAANSMQLKAFSSTYPAAAGLYYVALLYHSSAQTTAPSNYGFTSGGLGAMSADFTNSAKLNCQLAAQNSLPSPQAMSGLAAAGGTRWWGLY